MSVCVSVPQSTFNEFRSVGSELWSGGRGWILVGVAGGWFLSLGVRLVYPALLPYIREAFSLGLTTAGFLLTVLWIAYALGQLPGGIIGDRLGEGNAIILSTIVSGLAIATVALSTHTWVLFLATTFFGFSTATFGPARFTILSAIYDKRDGTAVGLSLSAGEAGNATLPVIATVLATTVSWRLGFGVTVPLFFLMALVLYKVVPAQLTTGSAVDSLSIDTFRYVVRGVSERTVLIVSGIHLALFFVTQGFTGFYPTYLIEAKELSPTLAAGLFGLFFVTGIFVQPLAGAGGDRYGHRRMLIAVALVATLSLVALPFVDSFAGLVGLTIVASTLLGATPLTQTYIVNHLPADMRGTGLGLLRTSYIALGATGPLVVGIIADVGYFDEAFLGLAAVAGAGILLARYMPTA